MKVSPKCHIQRSLLDKKSKKAQIAAAQSVKVHLNLLIKQRLPDGAALLHHLGPVEPGQFAESVIAVDDGPLHDLGVAYEEAGL